MSVWLTKVIWWSESADLHKLLFPRPPLKHRCCPLTAQETSSTTYPRNQQLFSENPDPRNKWTVNHGLHIPVSPENIPCSRYVNGRIHDSEERSSPQLSQVKMCTFLHNILQLLLFKLFTQVRVERGLIICSNLIDRECRCSLRWIKIKS